MASSGDTKTRRPRLTRRALLNLLGAAASWPLLSQWRGKAQAATAGAAAGKPAFPKGAIVRTVLKDLAPAELGAMMTLLHDHVASETVDPLVVDQLVAARKLGIGCIVNPESLAPVADIENLRTLSRQSGVHIVACGGYFMQFNYPADIATRNEDEIAAGLVRDAAAKGLGAFGEIGQSSNMAALTADERKVFRAVGKAHLATNLPIITHNPYGTGPNVPMDAGLRQLDVFESVGVSPERVMIGHVCCLDDPNATVAIELARRGAYVGFDRIGDAHPPLPVIGPQGRVMYDVPDEQRVREMLAVIEAGHADRLLLAEDAVAQPLKGVAEIDKLTREHFLEPADGDRIRNLLYTSAGLGRVLTVFVPKLRKAGIREATLHQILYDNPRRFLAFTPK